MLAFLMKRITFLLSSLILFITIYRALIFEVPHQGFGILILATLSSLTVMNISYMLLSRFLSDAEEELISSIDSPYLLYPLSFMIILVLFSWGFDKEVRIILLALSAFLIVSMNYLHYRLYRKYQARKGRYSQQENCHSFDHSQESLDLLSFLTMIKDDKEQPLSTIIKKYDMMDMMYFIIGLLVFAIGLISAIWLLWLG